MPATPRPHPTPSAAADETRVVTTDQGEVTVPADPQRIVVLNSALAGYLYALDVPVHGAIPLNTQTDEFPEAWAEEAAEDGTVMIPWTDAGFDIEALAAEAPDLIIGGGQGFPAVQAEQVYGQLSQVAPTVLVSADLTTWQGQLDHLATDVLGVPDAEQELLDAYDEKVAEVRDAIDLPATPVGYLLMLADGTPYSIPEDAQLPQTLAEVGLEPAPVIADNPDFQTYGSGDSFELSREQVGIVVTAPTVFVLGFQADTVTAESLAADPVFAALPAFQAGSVYDLPSTANRADWYATMDLLDVVQAQFG
ncbi:ABC transporter substrate-binding protein [Modestobacter sp. Leaf380]|uniref:ABC transporter substrate-binding protein n=1 Tax=Modestobacter sp. Leaf380 TaxID=1736356 RepID=UPI0009E74A81|nr:ABC transporter substrate-binding protein [Modestobacter sp. Leaf380]